MMLKKVLVASAVSVLAVAQAPAPVEKLDIKKSVQSFIDTIVAKQDTRGGWLVVDRKKSADGERFGLLFKEAKAEDNLSMDYAELAGTRIDNTLKYASDSFHATSLLTALPKADAGDKGAQLVIDQIITKKLVEITTDYSLKDYHYSMTFKDIKERLGKKEVDVEMRGAGITGIYDITDTLNQKAKIGIERLYLAPQDKQYKGEYIDVKESRINVETVVAGKSLDFKYSMGLGSLESNFSKEYTEVKAFNLDLTIGGLNVAAYRALEQFAKANPDLSENDPKLQKLSMDLFTGKGLFIEIEDLSIANLLVAGQKFGSAKVTAKVSLAGDNDIQKMLAVNPLMVLSALNVVARVELSESMLTTLMSTQEGAMLAMLPKKKVKGNYLYDITFAKGKLAINGQKF